MTQLKRVTVQGLQNGTQFNIFDCYGIPLMDPRKEILEEDLIKVINGNIMKDYEVMFIFSEGEYFS